MRAEAFGPYVVYEQIGLGGMATVHRAETQGVAGFSKQVALKRMLPNVAADPSLVKSFIREAHLASHLRHANVAQTYDLGKVGETYFIAMELVPGRNLREILKHCAMVAGHMPLSIVMNIVGQIADALDYAHNLCDESGQPLGIIHRDVSPANVIVSEGGIVKLIDFGIAKASHASGMATMSGTIKGKFSYMAPENLLGHADARSDLFALGVIAHELLSNRPLLQGTDDMDTLYRVRDMPILPPSQINSHVPPEIDAIIMTALERDPDRRWQRASAMRQALTLETQRLGLAVQNAQVYEWVEHAFTAQFREESEPSIEISQNTAQLAKGTVVPDEFSEATDSLATVVSQPRLDVFDVPTVARAPDDRILAEAAATDWNSPGTAETRYDRPRLGSAPPSNARASSPHVVPRQRPSAPPLAHPPFSGAHTLPHSPRASDAVQTDVRVSASAILREANVAPAVTDHNIVMPSSTVSAARTKVDDRPRRRAGTFLLAVLVIIAAGGAAAVVYFALPYLTR